MTIPVQIKEETFGDKKWLGIRSGSSEWSWIEPDQAVSVAQSLLEKSVAAGTPCPTISLPRRRYGWRLGDH